MSSSRRLVGILAAVAVLAVCTGGFAGVIRDDVSDTQYLNLGSQYPSVGQFSGSTGTSGFLASGTLIAPNWVLTAAHVVDHATSLTFNIGGTSYVIPKGNWVANPSWTGNLMAGYDIALVHLPTSVNIAPAVRYTGSSELGKVGTEVGFGMTGTGLTGATKYDGRKRGEQNVVDQLYNPRLFVSDFDNPHNRRDSSMGSSTPLSLEGLIAPGDSGGGVFITDATGTYLAGVNSFAGAFDGKVNSDYGDIGGFTRVSAFNAWINSVIGGGSSTSGLGSVVVVMDVRAVELVPEPSTLSLLAVGGLGLLLLRWVRRRE